MRRIMIAGAGSGSGKTTITCALLKAFQNRGHHVASFKCGPDYIDPMFHSKIVGAKARNLDACFCDSDTMKYLLERNAEEISVIEGVMGYFDGVGEQGSSKQVALDTKTPAVIVIDCKGMSLSIGAIMQGFLSFRGPNQIAGFLFNRLPESQVPQVKALCEELGTIYFGRMPYDARLSIASRHLGLVTAEEITDLKERVERLAALASEHIMIDRLWELAGQAGELIYQKPDIKTLCHELGYAPPCDRLRIAVARDEAFCFYYADNLELLEELGCEIVEFSPLRDQSLPKGISGLILGGGYPELYAGELSENENMKCAVKEAIEEGLPTIAECGGFMYLHREMEDADGGMKAMVGYIDGSAKRTEKLQRFGYVDLHSRDDTMLAHAGESMAAHEFHYWDSDSCGGDYQIVKQSNGLRYNGVVANEHVYAGFPHLYFYANPRAAVRYVMACREYQKKQGVNI